MSQVPLQTRASRAVVRYQARLEGSVGDRWIPAVVAVALTVVLGQLALARIEGLMAGIDLAGYHQAAWMLGEGYVPRPSLFGTGVHLLELRWAFIMYVFGAAGRVVPLESALVTVQAVALGLAVFPLWGLARRVAKLRIGAAGAVVLAYGLHPATHRLGVDDFHPETLAVPAIIGMAYFGATKSWVWYWVCFVLALSCRADFGLALGLWGLVLLGDGERRAGLWSLGVGFVWSLALLLILQPIIAQPGGAPGRGGYGGLSLGDVVLDSFRDPIAGLGQLVTQENLTLIVGLLAPVIFLPLLSLRHFLPVLPLVGLLLLSHTAIPTPFAERAAVFLAFGMVASTYALNRLGTMGVDRVFLDVRLLTTLAAASTLFFVATSPTSPFEEPWRWGEVDATDQAVYQAVERLGDDTEVKASPSALLLLADRGWLHDIETDVAPSAAAMGFPSYVRAVLLVERELPQRSDEERSAFDDGMTVQGFELLSDSDGVLLYVRS